jgi:hypothetical protein
MERKLKAMMTTVSWMFVFVLFTVIEAQPTKSQQTWRGFVTDTHCGTNCQVKKDMTPDKKCVDRCVREGSKYGLWVGRHVYELEPQSKAARFAAIDVTVIGTRKGETIHIDSIEPSKHAVTRKSKINKSP